jgi:hypothetical protein
LGLILLIVLGTLIGFDLRPAGAFACGEGQHNEARATPKQIGVAPLEIGDSTSIFAAPILGHLGIEADAHGCRQASQGLQILSARRSAGTLPHVVVFALGANGAISSGQVASALGILGTERVLALVTAKRSPANNAEVRAAAAAHRDRVLLIDWDRFSSAHGSWFAGDGLHVNQAGASAYAHLIERSIRHYAFPPVHHLHLSTSAKGRKSCGPVRESGHRLRVYVLRGVDLATCATARSVVRQPPLDPFQGWNSFDWRPTHNGPWQWVYQRQDRRVTLGATAA